MDCNTRGVTGRTCGDRVAVLVVEAHVLQHRAVRPHGVDVADVRRVGSGAVVAAAVDVGLYWCSGLADKCDTVDSERETDHRDDRALPILRESPSPEPHRRDEGERQQDGAGDPVAADLGHQQVGSGSLRSRSAHLDDQVGPQQPPRRSQRAQQIDEARVAEHRTQQYVESLQTLAQRLPGVGRRGGIEAGRRAELRSVGLRRADQLDKRSAAVGLDVGEVLGEVVEQVLAFRIGQIRQRSMHCGDIVVDLARDRAHAASPISRFCMVPAKSFQTFVESSRRARPALLIA